VKEEIVSKEQIKLLEKELGTLTDKLEKLNKDLREIEDLKSEIKGLKLFLGRAHPEFKAKFPEIMEKVYKKR
jgi:predicted  nucleic acid-binding Zn-ribbon protein